MKIDNKESIHDLEKSIRSFKKQKHGLDTSIAVLRQKKLKLILQYHQALILLDFYKNFQYNNNAATTLEQIFRCSFWAHILPYSDHGEGSYVKINFSLKGDFLKLSFYCTYYDNNKGRHMISIPLILFSKDSDDQLRKFLDDFFKAEEEKVMARAKHNDSVNKQIDKLKSQLK
jgi:hypothetical protein